MSILISQTRPLASGQNGHVSGAAKAAREDGRAVGIRLRAQDDAHAVGALLELRELEQYVACRVTGAVRTGQAARARGPRDRYLVRESLIGAHTKARGSVLNVARAPTTWSACRHSAVFP